MKKDTAERIFVIPDFRFEDTSVEELKELRKSGIAGLVLKIDGKLYYAQISKDVNLSSANYLGNHLCSHRNVICNRLSATSDEQGGCAKVRDCSCGIEYYDWIVRGYETFGTEHDVFIVAKCDHFEKCPPRKQVSATERKNMLSTLKSFWRDTGNHYNWWGNIIPIGAHRKIRKDFFDDYSGLENR